MDVCMGRQIVACCVLPTDTATRTQLLVHLRSVAAFMQQWQSMWHFGFGWKRLKHLLYSFQTPAFQYIPKSRVARHERGVCLAFQRMAKRFSKVVTILHCHQHHMRFPVAPYPPPN